MEDTINEFYSFNLKVELIGNYDKHLLFPMHQGEPDDFNPYLWMLDVFSEERCFPYWGMSDKGVHVLFPSDISSASFHMVESNDTYHGIVCYHHMLKSLSGRTENLELEISGFGYG
jgi:hypothetical protein